MEFNQAYSQYEQLGGEEAILRLVTRFYELMDELPEAHGIRKMHSADLSGARDKLFKFLSGWLGGPQLYVQEYGHPRLRARHLPFPIAEAERDAWMLCMTQALDELKLGDGLQRTYLLQSLYKTADFIRNQ